jgi:hypothetical protein
MVLILERAWSGAAGGVLPEFARQSNPTRCGTFESLHPNGLLACILHDRTGAFSGEVGTGSPQKMRQRIREFTMRMVMAFCAAAAALALAAAGASAQEKQENYASWPVLKSTFPSTGGGIMIKGYDPVIVGDKCVTTFMAVEPGPGGKVYPNFVEFEAVPAAGGTLCRNGKWRAFDGGATGTTPFRVFFKDGVFRGSQ